MLLASRCHSHTQSIPAPKATFEGVGNINVLRSAPGIGRMLVDSHKACNISQMNTCHRKVCCICPSLPSQGRIGYQVYVIYSRWVVSHRRKKLIMTGVMRAGIQQSACSSIDEVASFHHLMEHVSLIKPVVYQGLVQVLCLNALLMFPGKGRWADNRDMLRKHCFAARVP